MNTASPTIAPTGSRKTRSPELGNALPSPSLHAYAVFVACATFILVIAGGWVKSTGSSLAVPDWPLSFGQFFPKMEGGVLYEHSHRMIAGTVALLTFGLVGWLWKQESRRGVRMLGLAACAAVVLQALLGGLTVLYRLPVPISVAHGCLGQIFFCMMVSLAVLTGFSEPLVRPERMSKLQRLALLTLGFIFFQLVAGAFLRNTGKGLHVHFLGAFLVTVHIPLLARRVFKEARDRIGMVRWATLLPVLLIVQLILGFISWKSGPVVTVTAHVAIGALIFAGTSVIALLSFRPFVPSPLAGEGQDEGGL